MTTEPVSELILRRLESIQNDLVEHGKDIATLVERSKASSKHQEEIGVKLENLHTPLSCPIAVEVAQIRRKMDKWGGVALGLWFVLTIVVSFTSRWIPNPWR